MIGHSLSSRVSNFKLENGDHETACVPLLYKQENMSTEFFPFTKEKDCSQCKAIKNSSSNINRFLKPDITSYLFKIINTAGIFTPPVNLLPERICPEGDAKKRNIENAIEEAVL